MKRKITLTAAFALSLLPMLMDQYGGARGVQEIKGIIALLCPIGLVSVLMYVGGVWLAFKNSAVNKWLSYLGMAGIVAAEIYTFFTWYAMTITGEISLSHSLRLAYPEFYLGLLVSLAMIGAYRLIDKRCPQS